MDTSTRFLFNAVVRIGKRFPPTRTVQNLVIVPRKTNQDFLGGLVEGANAPSGAPLAVQAHIREAVSGAPQQSPKRDFFLW